VLSNITGGVLSYIKSTDPKIKDLSDRLYLEGYNPYEYLLFYVNDYKFNKGGLANLRYVNQWTSDSIWLEFLKHKKMLKQHAGKWYNIQTGTIDTRLRNNLSTPLDILTTDILQLDRLVKLDLAIKHKNDDPLIEQYIHDNWNVGVFHAFGYPEYLPFTTYLTEHLVKNRSVCYV
jgi:hypothetical protein